jgi:glycosyltransferase involved in cell wall biosynthesis
MGVSVLIPCFNTEAFLGEAIESALSQSHPPDEIIVIDDGSTDGSLRIATSFGCRVRVVGLEHVGVGAARNAGLLAAREEFVAWLDADDLWQSRKLEYQLPHMANPNVALVYGQMQRIGAARNSQAWPLDLPEGNIFERLYVQRNFIPTSSVLVRRQALIDAGGFDTSVAPGAEDLDAWLRIAIRWCVAVVPRVLCLYRVHPNQITRDHARSIRSGLRVREKLAAEFEHRTGISSDNRRRLVAKIFRDEISRLIAMRDLPRARATAIVLQQAFASDRADLRNAIAYERLIASLPRQAFFLRDLLKELMSWLRDQSLTWAPKRLRANRRRTRF